MSPISNEIMEEAKRRVHAELNAQWDKFYEMHGGHENDERAVFRSIMILYLLFWR